ARLLHPAPLQPPPLLQPVEKGIERRDVEAQASVRARLDELADLVAVARTGFEQGEDEELRRALLELPVQHAAQHSRHSHICYTRLSRGRPRRPERAGRGRPKSYFSRRA